MELIDRIKKDINDRLEELRPQIEEIPRLEAALAAIGADTFIRNLPEGYDTDVRKRGGRLSAGQRQLVSLARVVLADPAVVLLDEATSSLDIPSERAVQAALDELLASHGRTTLVIAHRLSTIRNADRILVFEQGRIVETGSFDELVARGGRFAELARAQFMTDDRGTREVTAAEVVMA